MHHNKNKQKQGVFFTLMCSRDTIIYIIMVSLCHKAGSYLSVPSSGGRATPN